MEISIYNYDKILNQIRERIKKMDTPQSNKDVLLDFAEDCLTGWKVSKIGKPRVITLLQRLLKLTVELKKEWLWFDERDTKRLLLWIDDTHPLPDGVWSQHSYRIVLRKYVTWLRHKYGYPENYPNRERLVNVLNIAKFAEEVNMHIKQPDRLRDAQTIPTDDEMRYLCEAAINPRDKAYIEMSREHGERIGGLGSRQVKHVSFDKLGALVSFVDKTFRGEPVRYISSSVYLQQWLEKHPFKNNPEAPLWVDLSKLPLCIPLNYYGFRALISRLIERHNAFAEKNNRPKLTKKITTHLFRYYAQTRDERHRMPRTIMCKIRGWSPQSHQPDRYARLTTQDVDEYFMEEYGLVEDGKKEQRERVVRCARCKEINNTKSLYCYKCGLPLSDVAVMEAEEKFERTDNIMNELLKDPELQAMVLRKWGERQKEIEELIKKKGSTVGL